MSAANEHPKIIQGGMGVAVSSWRLANETEENCLLGVQATQRTESTLKHARLLGESEVSLARSWNLIRDSRTLLGRSRTAS